MLLGWLKRLELRQNRLGSLVGYFNPKPRYLVATHSNEMDYLVREVLIKKKIELIICSTINNVPYIPGTVDIPKILKILS